MAHYKATADAIVFGSLRRAGEEFTGPAWEDAHTWPMPKHLTRIDAEPVVQEDEEAGEGDEATDQEGQPITPAENVDVEAVQMADEVPAETPIQPDAEPVAEKPAPGRGGRPKKKA